MSDTDKESTKSRVAYNQVSKNPNKYEEDYDPEKDTRSYHVYRNDIKYRDKNDIDIERAIFENDDVKNDFMYGDTDTIDYRIKDCIREKFQVLDLAHMSSNVFALLKSHSSFDNIASKVEVLSANDCSIETLDDLSMFSNLISLNIGDNNLRKLPKLPNSLEELIIDNNKITLIPYMSNLKRLRARNNHLRKIHYSDSMESLNLSKNPNLTELSPLSRLYHLEVGETGISDVPVCPNLKYLDLHETAVRSLPELPNLHILSCVRSELSDISKLTNLYSLVSTDSKLRRIHYMETLQTITYNSAHQNDIRLSNRYRVHRIFRNKNDVIEALFKPNPVPVNVMS
jgi:Leucine-rich repeat (LRR) protein